MLDLIYEKAAVSKVKIVKQLIKNGGLASKDELLDLIGTSSVTLEKYISELVNELPQESVKIYKNSVTLNPRVCNLYDVQMYYLSKSVVKDVLEMLFFGGSLTIEKMAQKLYMSHSKLFQILKFVERQLTNISIQIIRTPFIKIQGKEEAILTVYNLLLHISEKPCNYSINKMNEEELTERVHAFFKSENIEVDSMIIKEFNLWLLTLQAGKYLKKYYSSEIERKQLGQVIDQASPFLSNFQYYLKNVNGFNLNHDDYFLVVVMLLFNTMGFHFENTLEEGVFYSKRIKIKYRFQNLIFSILLQEKYNVSVKSINTVSLKVEGSLTFYEIIYPYYYLYSEFYMTELKESDRFQPLVDNLRKDYLLTMSEEDLPKIDNKGLLEVLAFIISDFQEVTFENRVYKIGIYSRKGTNFEQKLCDVLGKSIEIIPYHKMKKEGMIADLLVVDDFRLLKNAANFNRYIHLGDSYSHANLLADFLSK